jgi:hypothetical protein
VLWRLYFALLVVASGANSVEVTPALISVDLFVRDMSLVLAPLPDFILHNVSQWQQVVDLLAAVVLARTMAWLK